MRKKARTNDETARDCAISSGCAEQFLLLRAGERAFARAGLCGGHAVFLRAQGEALRFVRRMRRKTALQKHHLALYHALLAASGVAFGFSYPEDDTVEEHSLPGVEKGWRWPDAFVDFLMGVAGLSWRRIRKGEGVEALCAGSRRRFSRACTAGR